MARAAAEQGDVALDVRGFEGDPIDYGVEVRSGERAGYGGAVFDIHGQTYWLRPATGRVTAAVQERQVDAALDRQLGASCADDSGAADEEDFHESVVANPA